MVKTMDKKCDTDGDRLPHPSGLGLLLFIIFAAACILYLMYDTAQTKASLEANRGRQVVDGNELAMVANSSACARFKLLAAVSVDRLPIDRLKLNESLDECNQELLATEAKAASMKIVAEQDNALKR